MTQRKRISSHQRPARNRCVITSIERPAGGLANQIENPAGASKDLLDVFGYKLPILADLKEGWYLVAHPNGPAIAKKYGFDFIGSLAHPCDEVPEGIRNEAVWQLMKWAKKQPSWPASNEKLTP